MKLEFQYTLEEYREANAAALRGFGRPKRLSQARRSLIQWLAILGGVVAIYIIFRSPQTPTALPPPPPPTTTAPRNDLGTMLLQLGPWIVLFVAVCFFFLRRVVVFGRPRQVGQRMQIGSGRVPKLPTPLLCIILAMGVATVIVSRLVWSNVAEPSALGNYLTAVGLLATILPLGAIFYRRAIRNAFNTAASLQQTHRMDIGFDLIVAETPTARTEYHWEAFADFTETANLFLLALTQRSLLIIPKRAFPTPADLDAFRALAQSKFQPPTHGFPVIPALPPVDRAP